MLICPQTAVVVIAIALGTSCSNPDSSSPQSVTLANGQVVTEQEAWTSAAQKLTGTQRMGLYRDDVGFTDIREIRGRVVAIRVLSVLGTPSVSSFNYLDDAGTVGSFPQLVEIDSELKVGMSLSDALPILQSDPKGFFTLQSKDALVAHVTTFDARNVIAIFTRPDRVRRPELVANASSEVIAMMRRIPLDAMLDFGEYRLSELKP